MGRQRERSLESAEEVLWPAVRILGLLFLTDAGSLEHPHHHFLLTPFRPGVESTLPSDSSFPKAPFRLPNMWRDVVVLSPLPLPLAIEKGAMVLLLPNAEHCDSASTRRAQVAANSSRARSDRCIRIARTNCTHIARTRDQNELHAHFARTNTWVSW